MLGIMLGCEMVGTGRTGRRSMKARENNIPHPSTMDSSSREALSAQRAKLTQDRWSWFENAPLP